MVASNNSGELLRGGSSALSSSLSGRLYSGQLKTQGSVRTPSAAGRGASGDQAGLPREHEDAYFSELLSYRYDTRRGIAVLPSSRALASREEDADGAPKRELPDVNRSNAWLAVRSKKLSVVCQLDK